MEPLLTFADVCLVTYSGEPLKSSNGLEDSSFVTAGVGTLKVSVTTSKDARIVLSMGCGTIILRSYCPVYSPCDFMYTFPFDFADLYVDDENSKNLHAFQSKDFAAIKFPESTSKVLVVQLRALFSQYTDIRSELDKSAAGTLQHPPSKTDKIVEFLDRSADQFCQGITSLAGLGGEHIVHGAEKAKGQISRQEEVQLSENTKMIAECARSAASTTKNVTTAVAAGIGKGVGVVGEYLSKSIMDRTGISDKNMVEENRGMYKVIRISAAGARGLVNVWTTLFDGGQHVLKKSADAATTIVDHKYGPQAAEVCDNLGHAAVDGFGVYRGLGEMTAKGIAKELARQTVEHTRGKVQEVEQEAGTSKSDPSIKSTIPYASKNT